MPDFSDLAAEIADAFGVGTVHGRMREVAGGEQARIWRLDTTTGSFAVKVPRRGFEPRVDGVDVAFQQAVRSQTGVLMPTPVRRLAGAFVVAVSGRLTRLSTWLDLAPPNPSLDPTEVGRLLAALHTVDFPLPAKARVDPWYWAPVGRPAWDDLATRLHAAGAPFAQTFHDEVPHLLDLEAVLEPPGDPRMCHCDLWSDNLLATSQGALCVIDWDNCGPADPGHELGALLFEFGQWQPDRVRTLYDAYRGAGGPATLHRTGQFTMLIAQFGHFWQLAAETWLDPKTTPEGRSHQEDRVAELMDPPLRVETLLDLLAALP